ncbi:hypothetical protein Mgra_00007041 [Meloidogyne graminicola]|uniref:Tr-type G domain-containing protein n=1 Tax=Meloidogyne graminicola TaxID=189291 RepID=A0A8S9ZJL7_9BILA|nr:hypothetical protein Mgra_00007041 [Meloidogyne graminicola]
MNKKMSFKLIKLKKILFSPSKLIFIQHRLLTSNEAKIEKLLEENILLKSVNKYTPDKIRNFAIIAHIDHVIFGKSTLSDRLLQLTNVIPSDSQQRYLDKLEVEKERGITVFFEVKRSLVASSGALLLVAANQVLFFSNF